MGGGDGVESTFGGSGAGKLRGGSVRAKAKVWAGAGLFCPFSGPSEKA